MFNGTQESLMQCSSTPLILVRYQRIARNLEESCTTFKSPQRYSSWIWNEASYRQNDIGKSQGMIDNIGNDWQIHRTWKIRQESPKESLRILCKLWESWHISRIWKNHKWCQRSQSHAMSIPKNPMSCFSIQGITNNHEESWRILRKDLFIFDLTLSTHYLRTHMNN